MSDEVLLSDDQSHYEISLTAGQAFVAFVLLLLSLAASFAFGLMIGKGQADERLVVRKEPAVINEGSVVAGKKSAGRLVDLGVSSDDFKAPSSHAASVMTETAPPPAATAPAITEETAAPLTESAPAAAVSIVEPKAAATATKPVDKPASKISDTRPPTHDSPAHNSPVYAQLLVTSDQKTADALAAKLIDRGFMSSYVERAVTAKGTAFKVRVKFASEAEAKASEARLHELSSDVWITRQ
jgi:hypothetical protein